MSSLSVCVCRSGLLNGRGRYYRGIPDGIILQPQHNLNQVPFYTDTKYRANLKHTHLLLSVSSCIFKFQQLDGAMSILICERWDSKLHIYTSILSGEAGGT